MSTAIHPLSQKCHQALLATELSLSTLSTTSTHHEAANIKHDTMIYKMGSGLTDGPTFADQINIVKNGRHSVIRIIQMENEGNKSLKIHPTVETLVFQGKLIINLYYKA